MEILRDPEYFQDKDNQYNNTTTTTSTNTTTTRARARAREELDPILDLNPPKRVPVDEKELRRCVEYAAEELDLKSVPKVVIADIRSALSQGMEEEVINEVIDEAASAPRPSWAYARAILRNLEWEQVLDINQYQRRQMEWEHRKMEQTRRRYF